MHDAGFLTGPTLTVHAAGLGERTFAVGDHVIVQRNSYSRGALNGTRGVITAVEPHGGGVVLRDDHGQTIVLDSRPLLDGRLDLGYATTCHRPRASPSTSPCSTAPMPSAGKPATSPYRAAGGPITSTPPPATRTATSSAAPSTTSTTPPTTGSTRRGTRSTPAMGSSGR